MNKIALALIAAGSCLVSAGSAYAQLPSRPFLFGLWEGTMTVVQPNADGSPMLPPYSGEQFHFRLDIGESNLVMYFEQGENQWVAVGEGADLRLNEQGRSAIVMAVMSVEPVTQSRVFNIVRWDEQQLTVYLSQIISKGPNGEPPTHFGAMGQMTRIEQ